MMNDIGFIGVAKLDSGYTKKKYFYVKSEHEKNGPKGGHNIYRVLPPLNSLAASGKWSHYQATHEVVNSQGHRRSFVCIKESDYKTKVVTVHCPFCDIATTKANELKAYEAQGVDKEQLKAFREQWVQPFSNNSFYYVNAVDLNGDIGVLQLKSALHTDLKALAIEYSKKGIDIFGMKGFYLDFQKVSQYKGDNKPVYKVDIHRQETWNADGTFSGSPLFHDLTPDVINRIKAESFDLPNMYKRLTFEQIKQLADVQGPVRAQLVDKLWGTPERDTTPANDPSLVRVGNTDMYAVGRVESDSRGINMVTPNLGQVTAQTTAQPTIPQQAVAQAQPQVPVGTPAPTTSFTTAQPVAVPNATGMSDEEFRKTFGGMF